MNIVRMLIPERNYIDEKTKQVKSRFGYRGNNKIKYIVVHYTGDVWAQGWAKRTAKAMQSWRRSVSTHYLVGDDGIYQVLDEKYCAWHCGGYSRANKCDACNGNSVGVDLVEHKRSAESNSVKDRDWYFDEKVLNDGAHLIAEIAVRNGIPDERIIRHFDVTGKSCPRPFVGTDKNEITGESHESAWDKFKERIRAARAILNDSRGA